MQSIMSSSLSSQHWHILSSWSKAGIGTCIVLELNHHHHHHHGDPAKHFQRRHRRPPRIVFDLGATPCFADAISAKYVFLSHGHVDHIGALFSHARAHAIAYGGSGGGATYFVPAALVSHIEHCREAMAHLDDASLSSSSSLSSSTTPLWNMEDVESMEKTRSEWRNKNNTCDDDDDDDGVVAGRMTTTTTTTITKRSSSSLFKMNLVPVRHGDEIPLTGIHLPYETTTKTSFFMRAFEVDHAGHPALAYIIGSRSTTSSSSSSLSRLKEEYQHLSKDEIRKLVKMGISVSMKKTIPAAIETIEVAYTGDTCANGLISKIKQQQRLLPLPPPSLDNPLEEEEVEESSITITGCTIGQLFQAELLLCELTFLDSSENDMLRKKAIERGHIHINDLESIFSSHIGTSWWDQVDGEVEEDHVATTTTTTTTTTNGEEDGEDTTQLRKKKKKKQLVFYHLSARYQPSLRALDYILDGLPSPLLRYYDCYVAIRSMLDDDDDDDDDEDRFTRCCDHHPNEVDGTYDEMRTKLFVNRNGCISIDAYRRWKHTTQQQR